MKSSIHCGEFLDGLRLMGVTRWDGMEVQVPDLHGALVFVRDYKNTQSW